jgi:hypothetical protein
MLSSRFAVPDPSERPAAAHLALSSGSSAISSLPTVATDTHHHRVVVDQAEGLRLRPHRRKATVGLAELSGSKFYGGIQTQADGCTKWDRRLRKIGPGFLMSMWGQRSPDAIPLEQIPEVTVTFGNLRVNGSPVEKPSATAVYPRQIPEYAEAVAQDGQLVVTVGKPVPVRKQRRVELLPEKRGPPPNVGWRRCE